MGGNHWIFGGWMWVFWIAVVVGLFFLVKWALQQSRPGESKPNDGALDVLKKRYAGGEINQEEFEQKKKDLLS